MQSRIAARSDTVGESGWQSSEACMSISDELPGASWGGEKGALGGSVRALGVPRGNPLLCIRFGG